MAFLKKLLKAVGQLFSAPAPKRKSSRARRKNKRPVPGRSRKSTGRSRPVKKKKSPAAPKQQKKRSPSKKKSQLRRHPKKKAQAVSKRRGEAAKSRASSRAPLSGASEEAAPVAKPVGEITHYFSKIGVCVVKVKRPLAVGDKIQIKGHTTDFIQTVESMQVEGRDVRMARKGQLVGLKVKEPTRPGDEVYLPR